MKPVSLLAASSLILNFCPTADAQKTELLSLYSSAHQAIRRNLDFQGEMESIKISQAQMRREMAEFGWGLEALTRYEDREKPQNTREFIAVGGVQLPGNSARIFVDENFTARVGLKKKYTTGTTVEFGTRFSRLENTLNRTSTNALYTPEYESFTGITITQPLLQGFGRDANLAGVNIARRRLAAQEVLTRVKAMNLVAEVASRYTDIVTADRVLAVHAQNIELAERMLKRNKELLATNEGLLTDVTTAELALYQRQDQYITTAADKIERVNILFALIDRAPDLEGTTRFQPISTFFSGAALNGKRELINYGQSRRLDVVYYNHVVETAKLNVLRARDSGKPQLNLTGSAGVYGLSETSGGSFREARDTQGTEWSLGLNFKMPLGSDGADAAVDAAKAQVRQAEMELAKAKRGISLEVDTATSRVDAAKKRITTAKKAVELATQRLKQEEDLYTAGEGDFYRVVEQQQILGDAQVNLVASEAALSKSVIAVWLAAGKIFERMGISPAEVEMMITRAKEKKKK
ncbi:MAG: TolC family protein [Verrucomicrobiaceae bacterium]